MAGLEVEALEAQVRAAIRRRPCSSGLIWLCFDHGTAAHGLLRSNGRLAQPVVSPAGFGKVAFKQAATICSETVAICLSM